jgi:4'-phosphopantetheinyl transferase
MSDANSWALNAEHPVLVESEVHVWRAYLDCEETVLHQFEATLAPDEKARASRYHFQRDRNSFIVARGVLRELLGRYLNRSPAQIEFDYSSRGKPALRKEPPKRSVQFNVSHSHGLALLCFAIERQVGVDVELIRPDFAGEDIAERYFSRREIIELRALPAALRPEGFFLCWTRKEAYVKARGEGLHIPLDSFHVSLTPGCPARLQSEDSSRWILCSLSPDARYTGALVAEGSEWQLCCWDWKPSQDR